MTKPSKNDTKKLFWKKGTCSQTFFHIINRDFDNNNELHEMASDPLVGGIMQLGHQCGLLMGSTLAVGAECYRRFDDPSIRTVMAIDASKKVRDAFEKKAGSVNCRDITDTDFSNKVQFARYMLFKAWSCWKLADRWTEDALLSAREGLSGDPVKVESEVLSCASEVARLMGRTEEEIITVAGFAGGLGLGGDACGALIAAIWLRSIDWSRENPGKSGFSNEYSANVLLTFDDATGSRFNCRDICGREFMTVEDHSDFIRKGGCRELMEVLSNSI